MFHFVDVDKIQDSKYACSQSPRTNHSRAYKYFYEKCPAQSSGLLASGYCRQRNGSMSFTSGTFNYRGWGYLNEDFYDNGNDRKMHTIEQGILDKCYELWKGVKYNNKFSCDVTKIRASVFTKRASVITEPSFDTRPFSYCRSRCDCGCDCQSSKGPNLSWNSYIGILAVLLIFNLKSKHAEPN